MNSKTATILIVDADTVHRESMRRILRRAGYRVVEAADFRAAENAHQLNRGDIDLLLTAIALPGGNGYDLADAIIGLEPAMKVLLVSGETGAKASEFHDVTWAPILRRPFEPAELVERVIYALKPVGSGSAA